MRTFRLQALQGLWLAQSRGLRSANWVCPGCQGHRRMTPVRWSSSTGATAATKPYYATTPIFYVNAAPHIGHLYTMVLTDVLKRWQQIKGNEAFLCTGTDEHGMKIQQAAAKEGVPPKEFCDSNSAKFRELAKAGNISNDFFIRTTDEDHKRVVEQFWFLLKSKPRESLSLYKGTHEGWYCVSDECFYPEDLVQPSVVEQTGRKIMVSTESGNEVEWVKEDTWFFPLSKYKDQLLQFYDENPEWVQPQHKMNEVRNWVENHLEDLSITRPASRLSWGIPDPEDGSNTIYVWVDALVNYLTKAGFGSKWQPDSPDKGLWPADAHVVGKDIIRFHAVYWPAMLMAAGLPLPKKIICHNHWTMSNRKMSKSLGNVVNPFFALELWDTDPLRYFFMRNGSFVSDMGYSNAFIQAFYEKDLQANLGNLHSRINNAKGKWSSAAAVEAAREGKFENIESLAAQRAGQVDFAMLRPHIENARELFTQAMDDVNPAAALRVVYELLRETNRFVSETEPWALFKEQTADSEALLNWVVYQADEALRVTGIMLQPIMPSKCAKLLDDLNVSAERRTLEYAALGADLEYGATSAKPAPGDKKNAAFESLFPPVVGLDLLEEERVPLMKPSAKNEAKSPNKMNRLSHALAKEAKHSARTQQDGQEQR